MADAALEGSARWTRRPHFSPRQTLTAEQLNGVVDDHQRRIETLMRALHGHGVIFGFAVSTVGGGERLQVSPGMALDRHGRLLHWPDESIGIEDIVEMPRVPGQYTLAVHHARSESSPGGCGPCPDRPDRVDEGVVFTLCPDCKPAPHGCPDHPEVKDEKDCIGFDDYVCLRTGSKLGAMAGAEDLSWAFEPPGALKRIGGKDRFYDPAAGIPIACIDVANIAAPGCPPRLGIVKVGRECDVRPFVYRTPLLYELVRNCYADLAQVKALSWQSWIVGPGGKLWPYEVPWEEFSARFRYKNMAGQYLTLQQLPLEQRFTIDFTRPLDIKTVHPGSVFLTVLTWRDDTDYWQPQRIPIDIEPVDAKAGFASRFRLIPLDDWVDAEVLGGRSSLFDGGNVELTVRGQMMRDRCGRMLDARPLDGGGHGEHCQRVGGDFVALFRFAASTQPRFRRGADRAAAALPDEPPASPADEPAGATAGPAEPAAPAAEPGEPIEPQQNPGSERP